MPLTPVQLALATLLLPLGSAAFIALFLRRRGGAAAFVSVAACAGHAAAAFLLAFGGHREAAVNASFEWLRLGAFAVSIDIKFDDLAALMLCIVALVGFCVHVFSLGYMRGDSARGRYFGGLGIFMFSMTGIVLAGNLFMMFIFWELVGFSSWLLINHYCEKPAAAAAAKKAFIVNRVGDFGFLLGIIWCHHAFGTVNLAGIAAQTAAAGAGAHAISAGIPLLLFCGAVGKSAQFPLHVWLPDAMEGPTPVSALIHAATMVAAGIYMLCRVEPLFAAAPAALTVVMWTGVVTALYAALCAVVQGDIKKILAYSTLSQLGYMVAAFGLGGQTAAHAGAATAGTHAAAGGVLLAAGAAAAMFHLATHAFFKALLFLGAGSVIHGCHHEQEIFKMGGLFRKMPLTFAFFTIGVLAIAGLPFISGFYSKDAILHLAQQKNGLVFAVLVFTAVLTAFYMARMWKLVFLGRSRSEASDYVRESGPAMVLPLAVLAAFSVAGGWLALYAPWFADVAGRVPHVGGAGLVIMSAAIIALGAGVALALYKAPVRGLSKLVSPDTLAVRAPLVFGALALANALPDRLYNHYVAKIQQRLALVLNSIDRFLIDGLIVRGLAAVTGLFGMGARALHTGSVHAYVYWFLAGAALAWAFAAGVF
ncbi:MAG: NADH-quinone oxidoreductase subunit L [Opitutaceae bacterium]|jgi:NADH-quinone oxidoreductase subunit L|nr:NADH-quinone oxidoreductase subunit L [Opitutaceae bacterium]